MLPSCWWIVETLSKRQSETGRTNTIVSSTFRNINDIHFDQEGGPIATQQEGSDKGIDLEARQEVEDAFVVSFRFLFYFELRAYNRAVVMANNHYYIAGKSDDLQNAFTGAPKKIGISDAYIVKTKPSHAVSIQASFVRGYPGKKTYPLDITADAHGNIYLIGILLGYRMTPQGFIIKLDMDLNHQWTFFELGTKYVQAAVDNKNNKIWVVGYRKHLSQIVTSVVSYQLSNGRKVESPRPVIGCSNCGLLGVTIDINKNIYFVGSGSGTVNNISCTLTAGKCPFVAKYDSNLKHLKTTLESTAATRMNYEAVLSDTIEGSIYFASSYKGNFAGVSSKGAQDAGIVKYKSDGSVAWKDMYGFGGQKTSVIALCSNTHDVVLILICTGDYHGRSHPSKGFPALCYSVYDKITGVRKFSYIQPIKANVEPADCAMLG
ncbi:hypothetical protein AAMO2058_001708500 [Amorphochlora amoebiformis]